MGRLLHFFSSKRARCLSLRSLFLTMKHFAAFCKIFRRPLLFLLLPMNCLGQKWVDTSYRITSHLNIEYGISTDFAGNERSLKFDLSYPTNDTPPSCGRPLIVLIHGGAFLTGSKEDASIISMRQDFAKRGYVAVAVNYRLGMFHTDREVHCNASGLGLEWDCLNMADSAEWYRAYYRGVQDMHGALRYLSLHAEDYLIDTRNVMLLGESAGGFIAVGTAFMTDTSEVLRSLVAKLPSAKQPNTIYQAPCIQKYGLDTSLASMDLSRPDLGAYTGTLNLSGNTGYTIRGVASMFGAVFNDVFVHHSSHIPALYLYHQPNDLIVPFNHATVFQGYMTCVQGFPFNCGYLINRPTVSGSNAIVSILEEKKSKGSPIPQYVFEKTTNNAGCAQQFATPSLQGHSYDAMGLRVKNAAKFMSEFIIDSCLAAGLIPSVDHYFEIHPNPVITSSQIRLRFTSPPVLIEFCDLSGKTLKFLSTHGTDGYLALPISEVCPKAGSYLVRVTFPKQVLYKKLIILD